jgi:hypothetical protein
MSHLDREMAFTVIGLGGAVKSAFGSEGLEDAMALAAPKVQEPQTIRCVGFLELRKEVGHEIVKDGSV